MKYEVDLRERTKAFALRIINLTAALPNTMQASVLGKQVLRSGTSVGAQYREGFRAKSKPDFISKLSGCIQELDETQYWLELLHDSKILSPARLKPLMKEADELTAIFTTIVMKVKRS